MTIGTLPQSFRGYVGLAKEQTFGDGTAPVYYVDATSDGFSQDNQVDYQNTTRSRAAHKGEAGAFEDSGSIDFPANPENGLGLLLLAGFGGETFSAQDPDGDNTDEVGEHVFTPADTLPSLSVEVDRDTDVVRHVGVGVDTLELSHTAEERLAASVDLPAQAPDGSVSSSEPAYSDLRNFRFHDIDLSVAGTPRNADVRDLTLTVENDLGSEYRGNRTLSKMSVGERTVTATATLDFETTELYEQFLGQTGAAGPQDQLANVGMDVTWTTPETVEDTGTNYALRWYMPRCTMNTHEATLNGNDAIAEDVEFRALYQPEIGGEAEVTLTNGVMSPY